MYPRTQVRGFTSPLALSSKDNSSLGGRQSVQTSYDLLNVDSIRRCRSIPFKPTHFSDEGAPGSSRSWRTCSRFASGLFLGPIRSLSSRPRRYPGVEGAPGGFQMDGQMPESPSTQTSVSRWRETECRGNVAVDHVVACRPSARPQDRCLGCRRVRIRRVAGPLLVDFFHDLPDLGPV